MDLCQCDSCASQRETVGHSIEKFVMIKANQGYDKESITDMVVPFVAKHFPKYYDEVGFDYVKMIRDNIIESESKKLFRTKFNSSKGII